jgi:hypothetical protein
LLLLLSLVGLAARLATAPDYVQDHDGFYFSRAVERYSLAEMRPHWPGYPVYIWSGKLLWLVSGDARQALRLLSIFAAVASLWPIAWLASAWRRSLGGPAEAAERAGLAAALVWILAPLPWFVGTELLSDALGLWLALGVLVFCWRALDVPSGRGLPAAAAASGLLLGTRLAYLSLLLPLGYAAWRARGRRRLLAAAVVALALPVGVWLGWQLAIDGTRLFEIARGHIGRHLVSPATTLASDLHPWERALALSRTTAVYGLGGWWRGEDAGRWGVTLVLGALLAAGILRLGSTSTSAASRLPWLWVTPYALGLLLAFDTAHFPRYALPLVAFFCLVAGLGLPEKPLAGWLSLAAIAGAMAVVSVPLAVRHGRQGPVEWQLTRYVAARFDPARTTILVNEADAPELALFLAAEIASAAVAPQDPDGVAAGRFEALGREVFSTTPTVTAPGEWTPIARFCRDREQDPRGPFDLWLFRHEPGGRAFTSLPDCAIP